MSERDLVDTLVDQWSEEMPRFNSGAKGLVYRLAYLNERYMAAMQSRLRKQGLTVGSYGVLACLRRGGVNPMRCHRLQFLKRYR